MSDLTYLPPRSPDTRRRLLQMQQNVAVGSQRQIQTTPGDEATMKADVRLATIATLPAYTRIGNVITADANGALGNLDSVTVLVNDRVLLKNGASAADNGIYVATGVGGADSKFVLTRATDFDTNLEVVQGASVFVTAGTTLAGTYWTLTTVGPVVNVSALNFAETSATGFALYSALASTDSTYGASLIGIEDSASKITATTVEGALAELALAKSQLALTTGGATGAAMIGVFDTASKITATNVEDALAELALAKSRLALTTPGDGADLIGIHDGDGFYATATVAGALAELGLSLSNIAALTSGTLRGLHCARYAKYTYEFGTNGGDIGNITLTGTAIPAESLVTKVYYVVTTPIVGEAGCTLGLKLVTDGDALTAAVVGTTGTAGVHAGNTLAIPLGLETSKSLVLQIAVGAVTAGAGSFYVEYVS